jgi:alpha-beta hydrolase superfamily lysophospholipase
MRLFAALLCLAPLFSAIAGEHAPLANRLLDQLDAGKYSDAEAMLSPQMRAAVPAEKLKAVWESLPAQLGAAQGRGEPSVVQVEDTQLVVIPLRYEKGNLQARFAIDAKGKIAGFLVQSATAAAPTPPPADAPFTEQELQINAGPGPLPATLTLPKGEGPFPAIVLVHGSGPQDRDETIGPNRPFRDIAHGLAAKGIAVLRYDKRTRARPEDFAKEVSLALETTDDAVAAIKLLAGIERIDAKRRYVLGHSQGGMLAARIAKATDGEVAGLILFAAPARPILDLLREQNLYLLSQAPGMAEEAKQKHMAELDATITALRSNGNASLIGLPGSYWQQLEQVQPVAETATSHLPVLLLQGGRDFQVIDTDWQDWKQALTGDRYTFRHYPALNHLGIAGEGPGSLREYETPGNVDKVLIEDVANWVLR